MKKLVVHYTFFKEDLYKIIEIPSDLSRDVEQELIKVIVGQANNLPMSVDTKVHIRKTRLFKKRLRRRK